jgi:alpha-L-rhamnosidase
VAGTLLLGLALAPRVTAQPGPAPVDLVCEYAANPIGIDVRRPRLSWQIRAAGRGWVQRAYRLQVAASPELLEAGRGLIWDSGRVESGESVHRPYGGPPVQSSQRYVWRVRVWDGADVASAWSEIASWEMGLLDPADWIAGWITPDWDEDPSVAQPAPLLRRTFELDRDVRSARLYISSLGLYQAEINGERVGDQLFTPGWTAYRHRLQYQTYDVTALLRRGTNVIGATLGDGWYRGVIGFEEQRNYYGDRLGLRAQLRLVYDGGDVETVVTDDRWSAGTGGIRMSDIYMGEIYDARLQPRTWSTPAYDDSAWAGVRTLPSPDVDLIAPEAPPVRRIQEVRPVDILHTPAGDTVFDLGQNMVGWVRLHVNGATAEPGHAITLRHAEVLDRDGNLYTENLRAATQRVRYILDGTDSVATFEPHFSFQGFRYVAVEGYPGEPTLESLTGIVIHSDLPVTGEFHASNPMLDQLQHNIVWGQKGNFLDVPTDCPQRDERMGWTGDAQVFARTAAFNMGVAGFFTKWLGDLAADQYPSGSIPFVIPDVLSVDWPPPGSLTDASESGAAGAAGWADAGVIIPWTLYLTYGDTRILERQFDSMTAWVEFQRSRAGPDLVWTGDFHFGDWLAYSTTDPAYPGATTGTDLIATAFFAHSADLLSRAARILGRGADAEAYARLFRDTAAAFRREFVTEAGRVGENTQTAYALALMFDLLPEQMRPEAARRLADDVRAHDTHLTTGFLGTPYLNHVLTRFGYLDVAYDLLLQDTYPSWLYPVTQGATTIWERWDGQKPDGTFQSPSMNSFNHYAYGAVGDWMYRAVAGIDTSESAPGYKHLMIAPRPGGDLTSARATLETMYGTVESSWTVSSDRFTLDATVPANTTATIRLPDAWLAHVTENGQPVARVPGVTGMTQDAEVAILEVGSGTYRFAVTRN